MVCGQSPVGYWRLGESSVSSPAADQTSLHTAGTYIPATPYTSGGSTIYPPTLGAGGAVGEPDTAMQLPGGKGQPMEVPYEPYGHFASPDVTLEAWVATSAAAPTGGHVDSLVEQGGTAERDGITMSGVGGAGVASAYVRIGGTVQTLTSSVPINDGEWHLLDLTYDGTTARLWVDGHDAADVSVSGRLAPCVAFSGVTSGDQCSLDVGDPYNCLGCAVGPLAYDEVALFNRALTPSEIRTTASMVGPTDAELIGGGDPSSDYQPCECGDPVDTATGFLNETTPAISVPGRGPELNFFATYDSSQAGSPVSRVGRGWIDPYQMNVATTPTGAVVTQENGSQITFVQSSSGYVGPSRSQLTLTHNGDGTWTAVRRNTTTFDFTTGGFLKDIKDLNGNTTTLGYTGTPSMTTLSTVTDSAGNVLTIGYNSGNRINSVTDSSGRTYGMTYSSGNLVTVTDPAGRVTRTGTTRRATSSRR